MIGNGGTPVIGFEQVQTQEVDVTAGASTSFSFTPTGNSHNILTVEILGRALGATVDWSVSSNGTLITQLTSTRYISASTVWASAEIWYILGTDTTLQTFELFQHDNRTRAGVVVREYSAVNQSTPFGTPNEAIGSSAAPSVVISAAVNDVVIDAVGVNNRGSTGTVGAGQTQRYNFTTPSGGPMDQGILAIGSDEPGAASVTMNWSTSNEEWASCGAGLKPL
jgi:hypothetical protein